MEAVVGLLVILLGVSHGVKPYCDGRQDGAQCYGALGGTVALQLMDRAEEDSSYTWSDKTKTILRGRGNSFFWNDIGTRYSFTPSNGTIIINNLNRLDGGNYNLKIFDSNGVELEQRSLQLTIQAPVSSVWLDSKCLSQGEMMVSCSSEGGDSPQYSWTLGGRKLNGAELLSGNNDSKNITLRQDVSGQVVCSVSNHVSRVSTEKMISTCGFIFIKCISNGTHISQWVLEANNTLCIEAVTTKVVETYCDGRQDGAQCYGALGGTVALQLMDRAEENSLYRWSHGTKTIFTVRGNRVIGDVIGNRSSFTPSNGTIIINNLNRMDGGNYTLEIFDSNGVKSEQRSLQLTIQAPVSSVWLDSKCLSQGEMMVSCSSEGGDSPQYSWTLGGRKLNGAELLSGNNDSKNITLRQDVSGQVVCSVSNHVSRVSAEKVISTCGFIFIQCFSNGTYISQWVFEANNTLCIEAVTTKGKETATTVSITPSTNITSSSNVTHSIRADPWYINHSWLIYGLRVAVAIILFSGVGAYFAWKKKKYETTQGSSVPRQTQYRDNSVMMVEMRSSPTEL